MENEDKDSEEEKDNDTYIKERNDTPSGISKHLQKKAKKQAKKQAKVSHWGEGHSSFPLNDCVWVDGRGGQASFYSQHFHLVVPGSFPACSPLEISSSRCQGKGQL